MSEYIRIEIAKTIMGNNIIGPDELKQISKLDLFIPDSAYNIPFPKDIILKNREDYLLIYGTSRFLDGTDITIRRLKNVFGINPHQNIPCFYSQDWYENEKFVDVPMNEGWYFIRKKVYENSRGIQPEHLLNQYKFPSAITCTYSFFVSWLSKNEKLWYHDFIWCSDKDHNGDRIYVGKYNDIDSINKDGFSIHRHLSLRLCYACID